MLIFGQHGVKAKIADEADEVIPSIRKHGLYATGMSDIDDAKFLDRLRKLHVVHADENETSVTPHSIEAPVDGTIAGIDTLKTQLYEEFQMFNAAAVTAGNQTATAIWATYEPLDLKTNKFERQVKE